MKYRIRIMRIENGVLVFDRYATDKELLYLKPKADGNGVVELDCIMCDVMRIFETDVSDTHIVEWGACLTSTPIYENDIILIHDGEGIFYEAKEGIFALMEFYTNYLVNGSPYCEIEVIGNVWGSK